ncbi:MAG: Stp1/IreP family PP2C-type Ser/Thr phosphatase [Phycisphaerales bacterium]|jgi:protein phosphatase
MAKTVNSLSNRRALRFGAVTNVGKVREVNEDAFTSNPQQGFFIVSDGMGGHEGGKAASQLVIKELPEILTEQLGRLRSSSSKSIRNAIRKSLVKLNHHIRNEGAEGNGSMQMGATVVMALFSDERVYIVNVGDSRAYRLRNGELKQFTTDHSLVAELIEKGDIEPHQAESHPQQHIITQCIGFDKSVKPGIKSFVPKDTDRILLCSDGLTDVVSDRQITTILRDKSEPQEMCERLIKAANETGGPDNITVVVIDC